MRATTDRMSMQNTAPSQGDDVAASHLPCPSEPKIVPIAFEVEEGSRVSVCVINPLVPWLVSLIQGQDTLPNRPVGARC